MRELLDALQSQLESLSNGRGDAESLHAIFRCVHSIKGGAGAFGFGALVAFSHVFESLLDAVRDTRIPVTPDVLALLLRASDVLSDIVGAARDARNLPEGFAADITAALEEVLLGGSDAAVAEAQAPETNPEHANPDHVNPDAGQASGESRYRIEFTPHSEMLQKANEPLLLIRQLRRLGGLIVEVDDSRVPPLDRIEPEAAYLSWIFTLDTGAPHSAVDEVFEFVEDDCDLRIDVQQSGALLVAVAEDTASPAAARAVRTGEPDVAPTPSAHSIRVDIERIDRLVNLVGEMVITQAMLTEQSSLLPADQYPVLIQGIEALAQSARELQESVMAIRAQPVKSVFARMPRIVRDLAATLGR